MLLVFLALPLLTALALAAWPGPGARTLAALQAAVSVGLGLWVNATLAPAGFSYAVHLPLWPDLGVALQLGVDGLSAPFLILTPLVVLAAILGLAPASPQRGYYGALLVLQAALLGVYTATDLLVFYLSWEATLAPTFVLLQLHGVGAERRFAASRTLLTLWLAGVPLLAGILALGATVGGAEPFSLSAATERPLPAEAQVALAGLLLLGFAFKMPLFPFHAWLPTALMEGPPATGMLLAGMKIGLYGALRFLFPLTPLGLEAWSPLLLLLGAASLLGGGLLGLRQANLRRLAAFAGLSHAGVVVLALALPSPLAKQGAIAATHHLALAGPSLLLVAGLIHQRLGSTDRAAVRGLGSTLPRLSAALVAASLVGLALPGTGGFVAEHLALVGALSTAPWAALALLPGTALAVAATWQAWQGHVGGPPGPTRGSAVADLRPAETLALSLLLGASLWIGLWPQPWLDRMAPVVEAWSRAAEPAPPPPPIGRAVPSAQARRTSSGPPGR